MMWSRAQRSAANEARSWASTARSTVIPIDEPTQTTDFVGELCGFDYHVVGTYDVTGVLRD